VRSPHVGYVLPVLFGAQVRQAGGFLAALGRAETMGAEVVQLFVQSNRQWRLPERPDEVYAAYREAVTASPVVQATVCHAPYLINVISPDAETERRSCTSLAANLRAATALGASALILHPGSHRGDNAATAAARIARRAVAALDEAAANAEAAPAPAPAPASASAPASAGNGSRVCDLLFENTAGAGDTVGRSFAELAAVIASAGGDPRLGVCLDTQHLWASGVGFGTADEADRMLRCLDSEVGLDRLRCLHLNDSKVPFGANRDRHENLGAGTIGARPFRALLSAPPLQGLPAVLEVPGIAGDGPGRADLEAARALHRSGLSARRRRRRAVGAP